MDQVDINFEWHRGAQFYQGKWDRNMKVAMIPVPLQTVKIDSLFHCNQLGIILEFVCNA